MSASPGYVDAKLHRSLSPRARFRFVNIGRWASLDAFQAATREAGVSADRFPFPAHPGLYEVVSSTERLAAAGPSVTLINLFEVPTGQDARFLTVWEQTNDHLSSRPGYLGTRLHRSVGPEADFRFVNVALWSSHDAFTTAITEPGFRAVAYMPYAAHPALYTAIAG